MSTSQSVPGFRELGAERLSLRQGSKLVSPSAPVDSGPDRPCLLRSSYSLPKRLQRPSGWAVPRATTSRGSLRRPLTALRLWAERQIDEDLEARDAFDERGLEEATSAL